MFSACARDLAHFQEHLIVRKMAPTLGLPLVFAPVSPLFCRMAVNGLVCLSQSRLFS